MKLSKIANDILQFLLREYHEKNTKKFSFESIQENFPQCDATILQDACSLLDEDKIIHTAWASGKIYCMSINLQAIRDSEKNTALLETYKVLKEIREWL